MVLHPQPHLLQHRPLPLQFSSMPSLKSRRTLFHLLGQGNKMLKGPSTRPVDEQEPLLRSTFPVMGTLPMVKPLVPPCSTSSNRLVKSYHHRNSRKSLIRIDTPVQADEACPKKVRLLPPPPPPPSALCVIKFVVMNVEDICRYLLHYCDGNKMSEISVNCGISLCIY